jgi:hypothetical protein
VERFFKIDRVIATSRLGWRLSSQPAGSSGVRPSRSSSATLACSPTTMLCAAASRSASQSSNRPKESYQIGLSPTGGGGFGLVFGLGRSPFGESAGNNPTWRSCVALLLIARHRRFNRLAICEGEFVGHSATSTRSSSSVQRDMVGYLGHGGPKPAAMSSDSCGTILAIAF